MLGVVLSGCVACELRVTNHTGGLIQFYTGHTKKTVRIAAGGAATVPHSAGRVFIITEQDQIWQYGVIDVAAFSGDAIKGFKRLTLPVIVETNGLMILSSGKRIEPIRGLSLEK